MRAGLVHRNALAAWNLCRTYPEVWQQPFWNSIVVARDAQAHGAMQKLRELAPLVALLSRRPPHVVVEIGTARGGTLYAWCRIAREDATIVSIDLPGGRYGGGYTSSDERAFRRYGRGGQALHFIRASSHDGNTLRRLEAILGGHEVDFLFIDGDHTYEGVERDFEMYSPLVGAGRPIALHDILPHPVDQACEVDRFWRAIKDAYRHTEYVDPHRDEGGHQYGGLGVLFQR